MLRGRPTERPQAETEMSLTGVVLSATGLLIGVWRLDPTHSSAHAPRLLSCHDLDESGPNRSVTSVTLVVNSESAPTVLGSALVRQSSDAPPTDGGSPPGK